MMILANSSASVRAKGLGAPLDLGRSGTGCGMVFTGCEGRRIFSRPGTHIANGAGPRHYGLGGGKHSQSPRFLGTSAETGTEFLIWTSVVGSVLPVGCGPVDRGLRINAVRRAGHGGRGEGSPVFARNPRGGGGAGPRPLFS